MARSFGVISPTPRASARLTWQDRLRKPMFQGRFTRKGQSKMDIGLGRTTTTLESRFTDLDKPVLLSGIQALIRVLLEQARLDRAAGLNTGGLISGYRGSPLGGLDREVWHRQKLLD